MTMGPTPLIHLYTEAVNSSLDNTAIGLSFEIGRLLTFKQWPLWAQVEPSALAEAGLYYTGQRDQVKCFSCQQVFQDWTSDCVPLDVHKSRNPLCRFLQNEPDPIKKFCNCEHLSSDSSHVVEFMQQASLSLVNDIRKMQVTSESTDGRRRTPQEEADLRSTMHDLVNRLSSFKGWPETAPVYGPELAEGGFFFLGERDRVCCAFCGKVLHSWDPGDDVMEEHKKASPNCPYIVRKEQELAGGPQVASNITPTASTDPSISLPTVPVYSAQSAGHLPRAPATAQIGIASLPAQPSSAPPQHIIPPPPQNNQYGGGSIGLVLNNPHNPSMAIEVNRLSTFRGNWQASQSPNIMAKAGFYYIGVRDHVKCFFCDVGLQNWNPNEDPWVEHARWKPTCGFLQQTKGEDFIQEVTLNYANVARTTTSLPDGRYMEHATAPARTRSLTPPNPAATQYNVQPREVKARMDTAMVRNMIEMGFDRRLIHHVIETKLRNSGEDFQNSNALLDSLLTARNTWREPVSTSGGTASTTSNMSGEIPESTSYSGTSSHAAQPQSASAQRTTSPTNTTEMEFETQPGDSKKRKKKKVPTATLR